MPRFAFTLALLLVACGDGAADTCSTAADCAGGERCVDGTCVPGVDGGTSERDAAPDDDAGGGCPSAILCGSPPACCAGGQECIDGACLAACESGVRCGADLATCCGGGQVCVSDVCADVGGPCTDSYDCPEGAFCEPTLERCLPQFDPVTCRVEPTFETFEPTIEWSVESATEHPSFDQAIVMPAVMDLDGDRVPEVVQSFFEPGGTECRGVIRALRGGTGEILWSVRDVDGEQVSGCPTHALADLDGDGTPEIVTMRTDGRILALRADGSLFWLSTRSDGSPYSVGDWRTFANAAVAIADLDADGAPEVVIGAVVVDALGVLRWERDARTLEGDNDGYVGGLPVVADIDLDGTPEVVTGRRAYESDGTQRWLAATTDGYPAVGNFDDDSQPEVVLVTQGNVYLLDGLDGAIDWGPIAIPGGGRGGPPTVADFDGDGRPEIGVAGGSSYSVYDPDGPSPVRWSQATRDQSSNATGSAVFDFEGDGAAEVVYADECHLRAYRGDDGTVLFEVESSSGTQHEYPVVADVDGDGNSELLVVANDNNTRIGDGCRATYPGWAGERHGLFVYGDASDRWVRTRRVWNQHTYHVTNVSPAGAVPSAELDNWSTTGLNNYRQNVQGEGVFNAPDLTIVGLEVSLVGCPGTVRLRARVGNEGNLGVAAGVPVTFRRGTVAAPGDVLGTVTTTVPLLPGASTVVELDAALEGDAPFAFLATVDDDGAGAGLTVECDEDDNEADIDGVDCDILF